MDRIPTDDRRTTTLPRPIVAGVFLLAIIPLMPALVADWVYDDYLVVVNNTRLTDDQPLRGALLDSYNQGVDRLWRPAVSLTYLLQHRLHGLTRWPWALVNLLLHATAAALVCLVALRLASLDGHPHPRLVATIAGLLFAAHPVHVEAVTPVYGRPELMMSVFVLASLLLTLAGRPVAAGFCLAVAVLSKEQAVLLPLIALSVLLLARRAGTLSRVPRPTRAALAVGCIVVAGFLLLRDQLHTFNYERSTLNWIHQPLVRAQGIDRWLVPVEVAGRYTAALLLPLTHSIDHGYAVITHQPRFDWRLAVGTASIGLTLAGIALGLIRRRVLMTTCLLAVAATVGMVLNIATLIGTIFGERLMYLPSVFVCVLAGSMMARRWNHATRVLLVLLVVAGAGRCVQLSLAYRDPVTLFERMLRDTPESVTLHLLLGEQLIREGRYDEAQTPLLQALRLAPDNYEPHHRLAVLEMRRGDLTEARRWLDAALPFDRDYRTRGYYALLDLLEAGEPFDWPR